MSSDKFRGWRKSSLSSDGNCVEVAFAGDGRVGVRDSKQGEAGPILEFTSSEWEAFVGGIALGELTQS